MDRLKSLIEDSRHFVVFTGAGISTLSGIKDFRGKNGLYKDKTVDTDKLFDIHWFRKDPSFYYTMSRNFIYNLEDREPSLVHTTLAAMEKKGFIKAVITQNIDLLHQKAGSKNVIEVHGSPSVHHCMKCGMEFLFGDVKKIMETTTVPLCGCGGVIKPDITFFGEMLPEKAVALAVRECSQADLILVLGSTLVVQPAASFPLYTLRNSGNLVIVNDMETPLDSAAALRYYDLEEIFTYLSGVYGD